MRKDINIVFEVEHPKEILKIEGYTDAEVEQNVFINGVKIATLEDFDKLINVTNLKLYKIREELKNRHKISDDILLTYISQILEETK